MYRRAWVVAMIVSATVGMASAVSGSCLGQDDGDVDGEEAMMWKTGYGQSPSWCETGDFNGDNITDMWDFVILKRAYGSGNPGPIPPPNPPVAGDLKLFVDATGEAFLFNPTGAGVAFDTYELRSAASLLDTASWHGFHHRWAHASNTGEMAEVDYLMDLFGFDSANFTAVSHGTDILGEATLGDPIELPPNFMISLGHPAAGAPLSDLTFLYTDAAAAGDGVFSGLIIPQPAAAGDMDLDGDVDLDDFAAFKSGFGVGRTWIEGDLDSDDDVDLDDFIILKNSFGTPSIPEPATLSLLAAAGLAVIRRKR